MTMVEANLFRALPAKTRDFNPEEDEPILEPSWPHLQAVYEFFLRFVVSNEVSAKGTKKAITMEFCAKLIELFDTEDPRERDYLKTILHRIYGKFMPHRGYIRKVIQNVFYTFVYETEQHNGICELLEIIGSIVNGFALPLKKEHEDFLRRALLPLHKPVSLQLFQQQLCYSITQYMEKDPKTAEAIIGGLVKYWPHSRYLIYDISYIRCASNAKLNSFCSHYSTPKQVLFLNELEEILELIQHEQIQQLHKIIFRCILRCISSIHFQVAERSLLLWNNENLASVRSFVTLPLHYSNILLHYCADFSLEY